MNDIHVCIKKERYIIAMTTSTLSKILANGESDIELKNTDCNTHCD